MALVDLNSMELFSINEITTIEEEILRNAKVVLSTVKGQVVLDRDFGMDPDILDLPIPEAETRFMVLAIQLLRVYEPRAAIQTVTFDGDSNGKLIPKVVIEIVREFT